MVASTSSGAKVPGSNPGTIISNCSTLGKLLTSLCPNVLIYIKGILVTVLSSQGWGEN